MLGPNKLNAHDSRVGQYCSSIIEAGWLTAAATIPLFFNIHSVGVFEPDKVVLLRSITMVMLIAWMIRQIDHFDASNYRFPGTVFETPLVVPVLFFVVSYLISTGFSVMPAISVRGNSWRLQGAYTTFSYMVIFFLMTANLREKQQVDRLILTIILTSLPVALFAWMQHYQLDPLTWSKKLEFRSASSLGNAIFLGAYLIMVLFLTIGELIAGIIHMARGRGNGLNAISIVLGYGFVAAIQFGAIVLCGSRGPYLGAAAGLFFGGLLACLTLRRIATENSSPPAGQGHHRPHLFRKIMRWLWLPWILAWLMIALFILELNRPDSRLPQQPANPYLKRVGKIYRDVEHGTSSANVRLIIWRSAATLIGPHEPILFPDGASDRFNTIRPFLGHGPETEFACFNRFYPLALARMKAMTGIPSIDRSHNNTFDTFITTGLIGFAARQFILLTLFAGGLMGLRLIRGRRTLVLFICLWISFGSAGGVGTLIFVGPGFIGLGIPMGIAAGVLAYLGVTVRFAHGPKLNEPIDSRRDILIIGLLSAVVAHLFEIQTGILVVSTCFLFWVYGAILSWRLKKRPHATSDADPAEIPGSPRWKMVVIGHAIVFSLILSTVLFGFFIEFKFSNNPATGDIDAMVSIFSRLTRLSLPVFSMITAVWAAGGLLMVIKLHSEGILRTRRDHTGSFLLYAMGSITATGLLAVVLAIHHETMSQIRIASIESAIDACNSVSKNVIFYFGFVFLLLFSAASAFVKQRRTPAAPLCQKRATFFIIPVFLAAGVMVVSNNVNQIRADVFDKQGHSFGTADNWRAAIPLFKAAVKLDSGDYTHYNSLGNAFIENTRMISFDSKKELSKDLDIENLLSMSDLEMDQLDGREMLKAAEVVLARGRELAPLSTDLTAGMARLHKTWATRSRDPIEKKRHTHEMNRFYRQVLALKPSDFVMLNEWAQGEMRLGADFQTVKLKLDRSLALNPEFYHTFDILGDLSLLHHKPVAALAAYTQSRDLLMGKRDKGGIIGEIDRKIDSVYTIYKHLERGDQIHRAD